MQGERLKNSGFGSGGVSAITARRQASNDDEGQRQQDLGFSHDGEHCIVFLCQEVAREREYECLLQIMPAGVFSALRCLGRTSSGASGMERTAAQAERGQKAFNAIAPVITKPISAAKARFRL
jgi:hypothetical protein